jgi:hypothetical protein
MTQGRRSNRARAIAVVVAAQLWAGSIAAHEAGSGRAVVSFPSRDEYAVALTVDAASLLARLETLAGQTRSETLTGPEYADRIAALQRELMDHVHVSFDGKDAIAALEGVRVGATESAGLPIMPEVLLTLRGSIPADARTFTWRYDLTYAAYAFTLRAPDGATDSTAWLEGGQPSQAFSLTRIGGRSASMRVAALAANYISLAPLVVLGLLPFSPRLRRALWQPTGPRFLPIDEMLAKTRTKKLVSQHGDTKPRRR